MKLYLIYEDGTPNIHRYATGKEHNHPIPTKVFGIPDSTKMEIEALFLNGVKKPRPILQALRKKEIAAPTKNQLTRFLTTLRNNTGTFQLTLSNLSEIAIFRGIPGQFMPPTTRSTLIKMIYYLII